MKSGERTGAGSRLVSGHPPMAPTSRTPGGMKSGERAGSGSRPVSAHPPMAPTARTPVGVKASARDGPRSPPVPSDPPRAPGALALAAPARAATLNVVEPFMSGVGGIGLMLISRGSERHVLDFIGRAPRAADPARCTDDELAGGPKSCATPGNLGGWLAALERFGSMDRARVLGPAIALAEQGVPLTWKNVDFFEAARATLGRSQEARRLYLGNGGPRPGAVVTYKELAATLRQVAEGGSDGFYRGPIAKAIARAVREAGGLLPPVR